MPSLFEISDPLGFTNETAALITGLGCDNLTNFKKKNISLNDLKNLKDSDLLILEVGDKFDHEAFKKLSQNLRRKDDSLYKPRLSDVKQVLASSQRQLKVINIYLQYIYGQLLLNKTDYYIERNKNFKVTQALAIACDSINEQIKDLEVAAIKMQSKEPEISSNKIKYSVIFGGVGVIFFMYLYCKLRM